MWKDATIWTIVFEVDRCDCDEAIDGSLLIPRVVVM